MGNGIMTSKISFFTDLKAWKKNHELVIHIYEITKSFPEDERFGLISQIRRSASSITANIAEGFGRYHPKDKMKFYLQARGSSTETINHLILARDLGYISEDEYQALKAHAYQGYQLVCGLTRAMR